MKKKIDINLSLKAYSGILEKSLEENSMSEISEKVRKAMNSMVMKHIQNYCREGSGANTLLCNAFYVELMKAHTNLDILNDSVTIDEKTFKGLYIDSCCPMGKANAFIQLLSDIAMLVGAELHEVMYGALFLLYRSHLRVAFWPDFKGLSYNTRIRVENLVGVLEESLDVSDVEQTQLQFAMEAKM